MQTVLTDNPGSAVPTFHLYDGLHHDNSQIMDVKNQWLICTGPHLPAPCRAKDTLLPLLGTASLLLLLLLLLPLLEPLGGAVLMLDFSVSATAGRVPSTPTAFDDSGGGATNATVARSLPTAYRGHMTQHQ